MAAGSERAVNAGPAFPSLPAAASFPGRPGRHPDSACEPASLDRVPPDVGLLDRLGPDRAVREGLLPWRRAGAVTVVAATSPGAAEAGRARLEALFGPVALASTTSEAVEAAVLAVRRGQLSARAEDRTPVRLSCRSLGGPGLAVPLSAAGLAVLAAAALAPAFAAGRTEPRRPPPLPGRLPAISLLVPLFRERDIAGDLVAHLSRLDYPSDRLEICLIVEKHDTITRAALARTDLPATMRILVVPPGSLQTKSRALNYALDFTRGEIVGVYDAEDSPAPTSS